MSGQSNLTAVILPVALVSACLLLLINIWSTKTINQSLSEDVGRSIAELDMAKYQSEFCESELKDKEIVSQEKRKAEESLQKQLRIALETKQKLSATKNVVQTQLEQAQAERENYKGSGRQLEEALTKINEDIKKQEAFKVNLLETKRKLEAEL